MIHQSNATPKDEVEAYLALGWSPIILHHVSEDGRCTCGKYPCGPATPETPAGKGAGKHPRENGWQKAGLAEYRPAGANIGLRMGVQPNGQRFLALDEDEHGAIEKLERMHGELPPTLTSRSGSGGQHRIFTVPKDVRFLNHKAVKSLALDIKVDGGQIVVWPSVSARGPYEWTDDRDPAPLPEEWVRALSEAPAKEKTPAPELTDLDDPRLLNTRPEKCKGDPEAWAIDWCQRAPVSIDGAGGGGTLLTLLTDLIVGVGLDPERASEIAEEHYNPRCVPPWDVPSFEWDHKLEEAQKNLLGREEGDLLTPVQQIVQAGDDPWGTVADGWATRPKKPVDYVCKGLCVESGELNMICGYSGGGKTTTAMGLAVAVAHDRPFLGFSCKQGVVRHFSWETGNIEEKYKRIAQSMGVPLSELERTLKLHTFPKVDMTHGSDFYEALEKMLQDTMLSIFDSLTGMSPGIDQNSPLAGQHCLNLNQVCERSRCAGLLLHHSTKIGEGKRAISGHVTITGAVRGVGLLLERDEGQPVMTMRDVKNCSAEEGSVRVQYRFVDEPGGLVIKPDHTPAPTRRQKGILETLAGFPDQTAPSKSALARKHGGTRADVLKDIETLVTFGRILRHGDGSLTLVPERAPEPVADYSEQE